MPLILLIIFICLTSCDKPAPPFHPQKLMEQMVTQSSAPIHEYEILKKYPHDSQAFTEGIHYENGYLYESNGLNKYSKLRRIQLSNGQIIQEYHLPDKYFAEGLAIIGNDIYQLTYKSNIGFVYNKNSFRLKRVFQYQTEGWGLTTDGKQLIMSNGTDELQFIDPENFKATHSIHVHDDNKRINFINELEYIDGKIYANIFPTDFIAIISPTDGKILGWINLHNLNPYKSQALNEKVTNGIAYDPIEKTLIVTGKQWPYVFVLKIK